MPSSSSVSPPDSGRRGAAEEGGGGGRVEEVEVLGLSWALEPPTGAMSDTKTTNKTLVKQWGYFWLFYLWDNDVGCEGQSHLPALYLNKNSRFSKQDIK